MSVAEKKTAVENEINTHASLISQIKTVLETKSGGTSVQKKEGTFTTSSMGYATLDCGFSPDFVILDKKVIYSDTTAAVFWFVDTTQAIGVCVGDNDESIHSFHASKEANGFYAEGYNINLNGGESMPLSNRTIGYTAYKF